VSRSQASATTPYFHNGAIATLKEAAHFYNVRDVEPSIPQPEFPQTMNVVELAALGLTNQDQDDIVAFLGILTDGYLVE
jgi:cytochrome c peroxidase